MASKNKIKIILFSSLVLIVLICVVFFILNKNKKMGLVEENPTKTAEVIPDYKVTQAKTGELPNKFPKDFPVESGVKVDYGYNVTSDNNSQATIHFESKRTLSAIYKTYTDYLNQKNGWTVLNTLDTPSVKSISATNKQHTSVMVNMAENNLTKISQVTISFIYENKK
jgi:hypothetical protein